MKLTTKISQYLPILAKLMSMDHNLITLCNAYKLTEYFVLY